MAALDLSRPFSRAEALAAGISDWQLRRHQRVHRDTYVGEGTELDVRVRALAALKRAPEGSIVARYTAAELMGGVAPSNALVHLLLPPGRRLRVQGLAAVPGTPTRHALGRGVPVTTAEDTFVALGDELGWSTWWSLATAWSASGVRARRP